MTNKDKNSITLKTRWALFVIAGGTGLFIIGAYAGIYYWPPIRRCRAIFCDPNHWQILSIGIAFLCAGLAYVIPERYALLGKVNATILLATLLAGIIGSFAAR